MGKRRRSHVHDRVPAAPRAPDRTLLHRSLPVLRCLYVAVLAVLVVRLFQSRAPQLRALSAGARPEWLAVAFILLWGQLMLGALVWRNGLRLFGQTVPFRLILHGLCRSLPARYLPGGVWFAVSRAAILHRRGVSRQVLAGVAVLEVCLGALVAVVLGLAAMLSSGRLPSNGWRFAALAVILAALCAPPMMNRALGVLGRVRGFDPVVVRGRTYAGLLLSLTAFWIGAALGFSAYLQAFPEVRAGSLLATTGAFLLAWVVGLAVLVAPQGAGVFEVAVAAMLGHARLGPVALIAGGYRAIVLVRDLLATGAATFWTAPAGDDDP